MAASAVRHGLWHRDSCRNGAACSPVSGHDGPETGQKLLSGKSRSAGGAAAGCAAALRQKKQRMDCFFGFHGSARKPILRRSLLVTGELQAKFMHNLHKVMHNLFPGSGSHDVRMVDAATMKFSEGRCNDGYADAGNKRRRLMVVASLLLALTGAVPGAKPGRWRRAPRVLSGELADVAVAAEGRSAGNTLRRMLPEVLPLGEISLCTLTPLVLPGQRVTLKLFSAAQRLTAWQMPPRCRPHLAETWSAGCC